MTKGICVTSDIVGDFRKNGKIYNAEDVDALMRHAALLGATRYQWIVDTMWNLYDNPEDGYDLLGTAVEAAHRHNLRLDVVFKPFEGGNYWGRALPSTFPVPEGAPVLCEPYGIVQNVRPFVAFNPHMRLKRRPDSENTSEKAVRSVRIVHQDAEELPIDRENLTLWWSSSGQQFTQYTGPVTFRESVAWRPLFPQRDKCRILSLEELDLPVEAKYVVVKHETTAEDVPTYCNEMDNFIELVDEEGHVMPSTPALNFDAESVWDFTHTIHELGISRYLQYPELQELCADHDRFMAHFQGWSYAYDLKNMQKSVYHRLNQPGGVAVMRGKPMYVTGALNPVYPEVREHWLEHIRFFMERGVDGVNIRMASHNRPHDPWAYGFNEPVLERLDGEVNVAGAAKINGDAYTQFLREAADELHASNKELGVHVHGLVFKEDDRGGPGSIPWNFDWQWETWIREIADYVEFRGTTMLRPENTREVTDRIGLAARKAGIPFLFQSSRRGMRYQGPYNILQSEMAYCLNHPDVTHYNLYETGNFMRMEENTLVLSEDLEQLIQQKWWHST